MDHAAPINKSSTIPVIDVRPLIEKKDRSKVAAALHKACKEFGFFYISGHGVDDDLQDRLEKYSRDFFSQSLAEKMKIKMALGGKAWRGFFPVGDELTSGKPDLKEGLYLGIELNDNDPRVKAGWPLHGQNLFPENMPEFKKVILAYIDALTQLGHALMEGLSLSLGLPPSYFHDYYTSDPLCLFRIFHYPFIEKNQAEGQQWGVGEHTDYGVLTILKQDDAGGLQIKSKGEWMEAPVIPGTFICNIGDMLDRMTGGLYRSTPHRVLNRAGRSRFSYPFFFDPNWEAMVKPVPIADLEKIKDDKKERWDRTSVHEFKGTYGDYILGKVAKVFPDLKKRVK